MTATLVAATALEASSLRRAAPNACVVECGIGFSRCDPATLGTTVVCCGLAGGLRSGVPTGTVIVADRVGDETGDRACDRALVMQLSVVARKLGYEPLVAPVITSKLLVTGAARRALAERGYAAADMESALVTAPRLAVLRVVLDTPERELSPAWLRPSTALMRPSLWPQAWWLARNAPRCASIAASIVAQAFGDAKG